LGGEPAAKRIRENPKSEARNPKQTQSNKPQTRKIQNAEPDSSRLEHCLRFIFHGFEFVSDFEFRASNLF
jgi:hypothetical protein